MIKWKNRHHGKCYCSLTNQYPSLCNPMDCSILCFPVLHYSWSFLKLISIDLVMSSNHLILCQPLLLPSSKVPSINVFSNELAFQFRWPKYWNLSFIISPSNEYSELISFRIDLFDLLALLGTLKSLLQWRNSKTLILLFSAFFVVQLSHPYMATEKTKALAIWTFVSKAMSFLTCCLGYHSKWWGVGE